MGQFKGDECMNMMDFGCFKRSLTWKNREARAKRLQSVGKMRELIRIASKTGPNTPVEAIILNPADRIPSQILLMLPESRFEALSRVG